MSHAEDQQQTFPTAPPSPSAGDHEMRDYHDAQDASRPTATDAYTYSRGLTPYLGLQARLSQIWINKWTVLLILALIRTLLAIVSLNKDIANARVQALSGCSDVESIGSTMASMPYYMSQGVNDIAADGINKAIAGLLTMLYLSIDAVEDIILFIINMMTSTYLCLITLAVSGSLHVAVQVAEDVSTFLNSTLHNIGNDIQSGITDFEGSLNSVIGGIDKAFGGKIPTLNVNSSIEALDNLQLPSSINEGLNTLNSSIPTFADVQNFTATVISLPFEEIKKLINESLPNYTFDSTVFPIPDKQSLTFCSDNNGITDFFDMLVDVIVLARKIFIVVILILATLACIPMAYRELRKWRWIKKRAAIITVDTKDPLDAVYIVTRPYTAGFGLWASRHIPSHRGKTLVRWTIAYATTLPALFVLTLGVAGLLGCLCQFILLKIIEREVPAIENDVSAFADKVVESLVNASNQWAVGTNDVINSTNMKINHDVLGWVNTSTTAVNDTLNAFVNETMKVLNTTFGGTVLYDPILEVLNCLVLLKVKGIEDGLTWVHDHAYIDFPMLPNDTFTKGALAATNGTNSSGLNSLLASPDTAAGDAIEAAVTAMTDAVKYALHQETIISACVVLIWVIILLVGFFRAAFLLLWPGSSLHDDNPFHDSNANDMDREHRASNPSSGITAFLAHGNDEKPVVSADDALPEDVPSPPYDLTEHPNNNANLYNGQPYTLEPRPFLAADHNEKLDVVDAYNVNESTRRSSLRASSQAFLHTGLTPAFNSDTKHFENPFADNAR